MLKKAFEGELTREWRAQQTGLPTAEELLEQIKAERERYYKQQLAEWKQAVADWEADGKVGKKPRKPGKLDTPNKLTEEHQRRKWKIPKQWYWTQLGDLCFVTKLAGFEYTKFVTYDDEGDLAVIKAENAGYSGFVKTNFSKVHSAAVSDLTRSELFGGELLVVFVGAGTGNVATVPSDRKYFLGPNIGMARPYCITAPKYLEYFYGSALGKNLLMAAVKAVAQPSLSMTTIRQAPLALPSFPEQHQIVQEIESRLSVCDQLEKDIEANLKRAERLRQSLLQKAFAGELLTEAELQACRAEPDWEPAERLLERIKGEGK